MKTSQPILGIGTFRDTLARSEGGQHEGVGQIARHRDVCSRPLGSSHGPIDHRCVQSNHSVQRERVREP